MQLKEKIELIHFNPDNNSQHIAIHNQEQCDKCMEKQCLNICPSSVFKWDYQADSPIMVYYKQCIECGACRLACQSDNIKFTYPAGGMGVIYREG